MNLSSPQPAAPSPELATCNPQPANCSSPPGCNPDPATPQPGPCNPQPPTMFPSRGNGKVARLPKPLRDQINLWLLDGVSYPDIIERLGEHGEDLKPDNLSQWKKRGHQDWLVAQNWLAETRARQEPAFDLSAGFDATELNHCAGEN